MKRDNYDRLRKLLRRLDRAGLSYTLAHYRSDAPVSVQVAVPGERWEIDLLDDGTIDFERFVSSDGVAGSAELARELAKHSTETSTPGPA